MTWPHEWLPECSIMHDPWTKREPELQLDSLKFKHCQETGQWHTIKCPSFVVGK